jgi:hypothetical protein
MSFNSCLEMLFVSASSLVLKLNEAGGRLRKEGWSVLLVRNRD